MRHVFVFSRARMSYNVNDIYKKLRILRYSICYCKLVCTFRSLTFEYLCFEVLTTVNDFSRSFSSVKNLKILFSEANTSFTRVHCKVSLNIGMFFRNILPTFFTVIFFSFSDFTPIRNYYYQGTPLVNYIG